MKCNWKVGPLLIGGLVFGATPAMAQIPSPSGSWQVNYYSDQNNRTAPNGPWCVVFTTAANSVANAPLSGTWQVTNSPGGTTWQGSWLQQGDRLKWWGNYSGVSNYSTSHEGMLITNSAAAATGYMAGQHQHYQLTQPGGGPAAQPPYIGAWWAQRANC